MTRPITPEPRRLTVGTLVAAFAVALLIAAAWFWSQILMLVFGAVLIAIALRAGAQALHNHLGLNIKLGVLVVVLAVIAVITGGVLLAGQPVADQFSQLVSGLPESWDRISSWASDNTIASAIQDQMPSSDQMEESASKLASSLPDIMGTLTGVLDTVLGGLSSILLMVVVAIFVAMDTSVYRQGALRLVPPRHRPRAGQIGDELGTQLGRWMAGQALDMAIVAVLAGVGLWLLGVPLALLLALIAGLTNIVPIIGPVFSGGIAALFSLSQGLDTAIYVALLFTAIQMFEGNVLMPVIQSYAVQLPPALTIVAIMAFGSLFGFAGVILAAPLLIVVMLLVHRIYVEDVLGDADRN
ncbi:AI-2E family transporter [Paracoccus sp. JM45]|uniref:AI-2E family transporter n=1 Tax=Paracoccus sp. JM45 TaxID=2283626 RepID=UPI000E6BB924|nr:AI-2E family transporter [Paracoccus sp. JM45]RJE79546.1 AI-2E family transporter [Paracoccus sp. JM45]